MDLSEAVGLSLVPGLDRIRAAATFKELRDHSGLENVGLEHVIDACCREVNTAALAAQALAAAARLLDTAARQSILPVDIDDPRYPPLLRTIVDPPPVLWLRGDAAAVSQTSVALVGSRAASPYALEVARRLARALGARHVSVVSGLARGVEGAAHRGCLAGGGQTVAVLASGLDRVYPSEHGGLAAEIGRSGALVSELGPGVPPLASHFPPRNRLISGISRAVVIVEASEASRSLIAARCALEQGREVMAVPGSVLGGRYRGSHALLKDGAKLVESADDILEELGWPRGVPSLFPEKDFR